MAKHSVLVASLTLIVSFAVLLLVTLSLVPGAAPVRADELDDDAAVSPDAGLTLPDSSVSPEVATFRTTLLKGTLAMTVNEQTANTLGCFPEVWDLSRGDMVITFRYDARGMNDSLGGSFPDGAHAFASLGLHQVYSPAATVRMGNPISPCSPLFGKKAFDKGMWFGSDYNPAPNSLHSTATSNNEFNIMDKLILQKKIGGDETSYNMLRIATNPLQFQKIVIPDGYTNKAVWFDRDGAPGAAPGTFNTGGQYYVTMTLHAETTSALGTAAVGMLKINGNFQSFSDGTTFRSPIGMRFTVYPTDSGGSYAALTRMFVFYQFYGWGEQSTVKFKNIRITGWRVVP